MYKISVTPDDIAKGKPYMVNSCPIAKAVRRVVGHRKIKVDWGRVSIDGKIYYPDTSISSFVYNFDRGLKTYPFSFLLSKGW